ncbi:MAG: ISAs1 family transposase [Planctomycetaceae bacterium]|nr:ISAs1 family transposase [Planctomycetaceae bacterium]
MNTTQKKQKQSSNSPSLSKKPLKIRIITSRREKKRFDSLLGNYHYLGQSHPVGDTMRMVAEIDDQWIGLLMWGSAAYRLKPRDEFIGWTPTQRALRQKLIVQNRRFLMLAERGEHPNLASRILGSAIRELPKLWFQTFGYEPLLAETFVDIEAYEGTCYRASGWQELGLTKGYSRHRADFYVPNERPKKLWIRELRHDGVTQLRTMEELPENCRHGAQSNADAVLPLLKKQTESLHEALCKVPDPRASNRSFHIGAVLSITAMAIFSGHRNLVQIVRFANRLRNDQRIDLGLPRFKSDSSYRKVPSYKVFYNLLRNVDIDAFSQCLTDWLAQHSGTLPTALALDGKFIRTTVGIVCMVNHENGVPYAMARASQKEGEGEHCELKVAQRMIENQQDLSHALITADALHCQTRTAQEIAARGGEFILQVKDNQKTVHDLAAKLTKDISPFLPV